MKTGWQIKNLGELCVISTGKSNTEDAVENGNYAFFDRSKIIKRSSKYLFDCDAIIIAGEGQTFLPKFHSGKFDLHQRAYALFNFKKDVSIHYAYKYLIYFNKYFEKVAVGATAKSLRLRHFQDLPIPIPELFEQQRIVTILDKALEGIAAATVNAEKNLTNARELFESLMDSVFSPHRVGYKKMTLGDVCEFIGGSQPPKSDFEKAKTEHNVRLIQIRDYKTDAHITYIPKEKARRFCKVKDVMIGRYGPPIFQILRGLDGAYNVALMKAVPNEDLLTRDYLYYFLKHPTIQKYVIYHSERAAGQSGLNKETLEPYPIFIPSLDEQVRLSKQIQEIEYECQRLAIVYQQKLIALDELKKSILHQAFTGQLH